LPSAKKDAEPFLQSQFIKKAIPVGMAFSLQRFQGLNGLRLVQISFWSGQFGQHLKQSPGTIGSEAPEAGSSPEGTA
jgi:hypothetical protein